VAGVADATLTRIYLDNAATTWPKPDEVYQAVDRYQRECGAAAGRGVYAEAVELARQIDSARRRVASLIGAVDASRVVFTLNGTDSLNLALHGTLRDGDHVVTTVVEHNSVLRPLRMLQDAGRISVTRVGCDDQGLVDPVAIQAAMQPRTRLIALCHASNVTGAVQPAVEVGKMAHDRGALFLLDAAQTLGRWPVDVGELHVDLLAAPGHKGLLGPLGTGVLYVAPGIEKHLAPIRQGGTGSHSDDDRQPEELPDKYESGNLNAPGVVGLGAGVDWLHRRGLEQVVAHETRLTARLLAGLRAVSGVRVYGPLAPERRAGVVSITVEGYDPREVSGMLDAARGIQTRSGLHCAPLMHQTLGTLDLGGTVRFSVGPFNTDEQIDATVEAVRELVSVPPSFRDVR
jgi:cysteine desulfurase/selenocysteine lyase